MALNKVMLIGNVGQDPEVRYLDQNSSGNKVATFRLATTERYRDRVGELREITEWHSIVAWRNLADIVERFVKKGTQLYVEGRLRTRTWEDQNNNRRYVTEIVADTLQLLGRKSDNQASQGPGPQRSGSQHAGYSGQQGYGQQGGYRQGSYGGQQQGQGGYQQGQDTYQAQPAQPQVPPVAEEDDDLPF